jgi:integrase
VRAPGELGPTQQLVAHLFNQGKQPKQIAHELRVNKSTVGWHLSRLGVTASRGYAGRRAVCAILGYSGLRVSELCDLKLGQVRVHDRNGARLLVTDSKTETGIREIQISPDLVEVVIEHVDRLRRAGHPTEPTDYLVQNIHGGRLSRQRVGQIVADAAEAASARLVAKGLPPLPRTTPHTMRRTYISLALVSNQFDVKWVMGQVGHADSTMMLDVYAQLEQRVKRDHDVSFDKLVRTGRAQLEEVPVAVAGPSRLLAPV